MTAITSPLVTQPSTEWLDITEVQEQTRPPGLGVKLTKLTKLISHCQKCISYGYFNPFRLILS